MVFGSWTRWCCIEETVQRVQSCSTKDAHFINAPGESRRGKSAFSCTGSENEQDCHTHFKRHTGTDATTMPKRILLFFVFMYKVIYIWISHFKNWISPHWYWTPTDYPNDRGIVLNWFYTCNLMCTRFISGDISEYVWKVPASAKETIIDVKQA